MLGIIGIVEDEVDQLDWICQRFELSGYKIRGFCTAEDFLWHQKKDKFSVLLLDWSLPASDGLSVIQELKSRKANIPIVMMSGRSSQDEVKKIMEAGAAAYIAKPFTFEDLLEKISPYLSNEVQVEKVYHLKKTTREFFFNDERITFKETETKILDKLLKAEGDTVSRNKLIKCIPGENTINSRSLDVHISSIRKKLDPLGFVIKSIRGLGYSLVRMSVKSKATG